MLIFVNLNIDPQDMESEEDTNVDQTHQFLAYNN